MRISAAVPELPGTQREEGGSFPGSPPLDELRTADGRSWPEARRDLRANHRRAWRQIGGWYLALLLAQLAGVAVARQAGWPLQLLTAIPLALVHGLAFHAFLLFGHEAAHYHLNASRRRNDTFADWLLLAWLGLGIRGYRRFHWQHHLHLGDRDDTEVSYHQCASVMFLLRLLSGVYLLEVVGRYLVRSPSPRARATSAIDGGSLARFALYHGAVLVPLAIGGLWRPAAAWLGGLLLAFPAINSLRQMLEHRQEEAPCETDFRLVAHGPLTHDFGSGLLATLVGPAGFSRHLLHHWDPTVSYTNFPEMDAFLRAAGLGRDLDRQRRSYGSTLLRAVRQAASDG